MGLINKTFYERKETAISHMNCLSKFYKELNKDYDKVVADLNNKQLKKLWKQTFFMHSELLERVTDFIEEECQQ